MIARAAAVAFACGAALGCTPVPSPAVRRGGGIGWGQALREPTPAGNTGRGQALRESTLADLVNPFVGTATFDGQPDNQFNAGDTFPGAVFPFGLVQLSPDNTKLAGGYRYDIPRIDAFSLTHFSGRGSACWLDIGILPIVGDVTASPGADWSRWASPFRHETERASPGRYRVRLDAHWIDADLTVTPRTGMARFAFPPAARPTVLVNAGHSAQGNSGPGTGVRVAAPNRIEGSAESGDCGGSFHYRVFFVATFDRPFEKAGTWNGEALTAQSTSATGADTGAFLTFAPSARPLEMRVGISFVDVAGAARNLAGENQGHDFDALASAAEHAWNQWLGRVAIRGGTTAERRIFFTALYHTLMHPNLFSDADGRYLGADGQIHQATGPRRYENFAGWDYYRSEIAWLSVIAPDETAEMMASLVAMAAEDPGGGLPRWQQAASSSGGMVGDSQDIALATAHAFGVRGFDARLALRTMERGASTPGVKSAGHLVREGLTAYLEKGYVPYASTRVGGLSASITLEYASDDFAIAQLAQREGETALHDRFLARSRNWKNLWLDTPGGGFIVPRRADGTFLSPLDAATTDGYVEGTAEQYVWMVPFDLHGLIGAMGGNASAIQRLDKFFDVLNDGTASAHSFFGNEPGENTPWIYTFAGAPDRSQALVRRIARELYLDEPRGLPGNDDAGALSSWLVFASLGLYPSIPGVGGFVVGSPRFPDITVQLAGGHQLHILSSAAATATATYVTGLRIDGQPYDRAWIPWERVANGAELAFTQSATPEGKWATAPDAAPP